MKTKQLHFTTFNESRMGENKHHSKIKSKESPPPQAAPLKAFLQAAEQGKGLTWSQPEQPGKKNEGVQLET